MLKRTCTQHDCKIKTWFYLLVSYFAILTVAPESNRMCPFIVLLCLILMSDDANDGISETLHVRQNIGTVLHDVCTEDRAIIRRLEGLHKKHTNAKYAVIFTESCIQENLLPKITSPLAASLRGSRATTAVSISVAAP